MADVAASRSRRFQRWRSLAGLGTPDRRRPRADKAEIHEPPPVYPIACGAAGLSWQDRWIPNPGTRDRRHLARTSCRLVLTPSWPPEPLAAPVGPAVLRARPRESVAYRLRSHREWGAPHRMAGVVRVVFPISECARPADSDPSAVLPAQRVDAALAQPPPAQCVRGESGSTRSHSEEKRFRSLAAKAPRSRVSPGSSARACSLRLPVRI
jgi:hypothetical protein